MLKWLWLSAIVLALDQVSKYFAQQYLSYHDPLVLTPFFSLLLAYNPGAAFSFLSGAGGWQRWLFIVLALVVSVVIVIWLKRLPRSDSWFAAALALILGGAMGNVVDRILHPYVIDFLDFHYRHWHWPTFNLADSAITLGVTILLIDGLFGGGARRHD